MAMIMNHNPSTTCSDLELVFRCLRWKFVAWSWSFTMLLANPMILSKLPLRFQDINAYIYTYKWIFFALQRWKLTCWTWSSPNWKGKVIRTKLPWLWASIYASSRGCNTLHPTPQHHCLGVFASTFGFTSGRRVPASKPSTWELQ